MRRHKRTRRVARVSALACMTIQVAPTAVRSLRVQVQVLPSALPRSRSEEPLRPSPSSTMPPSNTPTATSSGTSTSKTSSHGRVTAKKNITETGTEIPEGIPPLDLYRQYLCPIFYYRRLPPHALIVMVQYALLPLV